MNTSHQFRGRVAASTFALALSLALAAPATAGDRGQSRAEFLQERVAQQDDDDGDRKEAREQRRQAQAQARQDAAQARQEAAQAREADRAHRQRLQAGRDRTGPRESVERGRAAEALRLAELRRDAERRDHDAREEARRLAGQHERERDERRRAAQHARDDRHDRDGRGDRDHHRRDDDRRVADDDRRRQYELHRQRDRDYRGYQAHRERLARERAHELQRQRRMQQYRYQQLYWQRLHEQQRRWAAMHYDYGRDPFYSTPFSHRYQVGGRYWPTNRYGIDLIRQAAQHGYAEGIRAGRADRYDGWRADYRGSWAYQDASYGYQGRYIDRGHYAHYFREGFRRGYEDGYYGRSRYGRHDNGQYLMISTILSAILGVRPI